MPTGIYKRGSKYWIRYTGLDGKQKRESAGEKFQAAMVLLADRKATIASGKEPDIKVIPNHTFKELVANYREWCKKQRAYPSKKYLIEQLESKFGDLPLRRFSTMLIEQFQTERLSQGKKKVRVNDSEWRLIPNKPATVNRLLATLSHMFTKAVEWEMVEENILKRIRNAKMLKGECKRLRYLSQEECQNLLNECQGYLRAIVTIALNTGMRKGEILSLIWDQVDLKHGFILLDRTKNGERREIPINQTVKDVLNAIMRRIDIPHVFFDPATGKPYQDFKRSFHSALKKAGISDFHFHDLRHTFASHLVMSGVDITTISRLLGHKSLTMTLRYSHLAPSHMVKALNVLDTVLTGRNVSTKLAQFGG
ncbi:MAG: site-specific integrase [Thermodesulfovibrionales bacterium]|nr:site-specific integrase [Thermodesulfovibrionales bacterium]